jgi:hypothetical protein
MIPTARAMYVSNVAQVIRERHHLQRVPPRRADGLAHRGRRAAIVRAVRRVWSPDGR